MALKQNSAEGGSNGTTVTTANSGGASGTPFDLVSIGSGGSIAYSTTEAMHGTCSICVANAAGVLTYFGFSGYSATQLVTRFYVRFDTLPGANGPVRLCDIRTGSTSVTRVVVDTGNHLVLQTNNGGTTLKVFSPLSVGTWYRIEVATTNGTSAGTISMDYYLGDSTTPVETGYATTSANTGTTANLTQVYYGSAAGPAAALTLYLDDIAVQDGTLTYLGPALVPPVAALSASVLLRAVTVNGSASSATSPATIVSYDWDWGDGTTHGSGATPATHTYAADGNYPITLTVTDSNAKTATTTTTVSVAAAAATGTVQSVDVSTGWTPSSGTALACLSDGDPTTYISSSAGPSGLELDWTLHGAVPPSPGQPFRVFLAVDAIGATAASMNAQLYDGATQRSALTGLGVPLGSGASPSGSVTLSFPWTDVQNVSTGGWNAVKVKTQFTAA